MHLQRRDCLQVAKYVRRVYSLALITLHCISYTRCCITPRAEQIRTVDWYFDFLSPFAYLQSHRLDELPDDVEIVYRPVLFGGLVVHWETKGPGQIPPQRLQTLRHTLWVAKRQGLDCKLPPKFPFNPLKTLRLALALGPDQATVETIFRCIWEQGLLPEDEQGWRGIVEALGVDDADDRIAESEIKEKLHENGRRAVEAGVFGVPTFVYDGVVFWGADETDFLLDVLADPGLLTGPEMQRIDTIPAGQRPGTE
jgi:2-hydroxychromene-2-carboxylate isomerase